MMRRLDRINLYHYSLFTLSITVLVILWGAYVRATGAGAGCGNHWPLCNGMIVPKSPLVATMIEFTHRVTSGVAFLLVGGLWMLVRQRFPLGHNMRQLAAWALLFMVLEALIGAGLVLFGLVALNTSIARAIVGALHLLNTFLLLAMITLVMDGARPDHTGTMVVSGLPSGLILSGLVGLLFVGVSGAITALGDTLFPSETLVSGIFEDLAKEAHFLIRLRVWHPIVAGITSLLIWVGVRRLPPGQQVEPWLQPGVMVLMLIQLLAGAINVLLLAPVWLQIVHLLLADMIWVSLILLLNQSRRQSR